MRIFAQNPINAATARRCQDFAPVMFADGCDPIGKENPALEKIQASKKFDSAERKKLLWQICESKIKPPRTTLISHVMDGQYSFEWQPLCINKYRHQRRGPIVHVQNLQLRCQSPSQFDCRFAEENKSRGIVFVRFTALAINSNAVKELIAANEKQLHATGAATLEVSGDVGFVPDLHIDSYTGVLLLKRRILLYLAVQRQDHAYLMPPRTQRARQRVHHIHERARSLQRRSLGTDH